MIEDTGSRKTDRSFTKTILRYIKCISLLNIIYNIHILLYRTTSKKRDSVASELSVVFFFFFFSCFVFSGLFVQTLGTNTVYTICIRTDRPEQTV